MLNGGEEGKARMEGGGHDKEVASSKFNVSVYTKIDTLFMTKTVEKPYPLGPYIPI